MQPALAGTVGVACVEQHRHRGHCIGNRGQQANVQAVGDAGALDDRWHPERQAIEAGVEGQQDQHQQPHARVEEHLAQARHLALAVGLQVGLEHGFLGG
ncbi:hypothetical protein D3C81_1745830 [compost metagenome]